MPQILLALLVTSHAFAPRSQLRPSSTALAGEGLAGEEPEAMQPSAPDGDALAAATGVAAAGATASSIAAAAGGACASGACVAGATAVAGAGTATATAAGAGLLTQLAYPLAALGLSGAVALGSTPEALEAQAAHSVLFADAMRSDHPVAPAGAAWTF